MVVDRNGDVYRAWAGFEPQTRRLLRIRDNHLAKGTTSWPSGPGARSMNHG